MAKKKEKTAQDLLNNPISNVVNERENVTPSLQSFDVLTVTSGPRLELMTRTTRKLARALDYGYSLMFQYNSYYIRDKLDLNMRSHVSIGGKGRQEVLQALSSGSGVPGEFFDQSGSSQGFMPTAGAEDEPDDDDE